MATISTRAGQEITVAAPGLVVVPQADGYLTPTVGTATTLDPGPVPAQHVWVAHVRKAPKPEGTAIANQGYPWSADAAFRFGTYSDGLDVNLYSDGSTAFGGTLALLPDGEGWYAAAVDIAATLRGYSSADGTSWQPFGPTIALSMPPVFDSPREIYIGDYYTGGGWAFRDRIYSVELRAGLVPNGGTVLWRFDANEYPGTGTSYADPRGRTWDLTAGAITPRVPAYVTTRPAADITVSTP